MGSTTTNPKQRIKAALYWFIYHSGLLSILIALLKRLRKGHPAVILLYHQIVDRNTRGYLYKGPAIHHQLTDFRAEMACVGRYFKVISLDEVADHVERKKPFRTPSVSITFDDGYRDNYTLAFPILRRRGFPGTVYLTTDLIGTRKRTWVDEVEYALLNARADSLKLPELFEDGALRIRSLEDKQRANETIGQALKGVSERERRRLIESLYARLQVSRGRKLDYTRRMLSWDEARLMSREGISFAAHTRSHPILTREAVEEAKSQIRMSKERIEEELGVPVKHFAFPNGTDRDFSKTLGRYCEELGFDTVATAEYGAVSPDSNRLYLLRFIPPIPIHMFAVEIARLFLFPKKHAIRREYAQE